MHSQAEFNFVTGIIGDELEFAGISKEPFAEYLKRNVNEMSGGELKVVSVKMALEAAQDVVLLDEPLDMLDDEQSAMMAAYIAESAKQKPIIIATHDSHFDAYTDNIIRIDSRESVPPFVPAKNGICGATNLSVRDLSVQLGERRFPKVSLENRQGEILCLYGYNGSGKTLFIRTISGIGRWGYTGDYSWQDRLSRGVCLQFPEQMVYQETVAQEIADNAGAENIDNVLDILGWQDKREHSPFSLSDGQKRTLYIISLLVKHQACVFDEPFAGLDQQSTNFIVQNFVEAQARGVSILYTANREADTVYADRTVKIIK